MDAFTAKEYASFHLKVLDEHLPARRRDPGRHRAEPALRPSRWPRRRRSSSRRSTWSRTRPTTSYGAVREAFWPDHPLGRPILGTKRTVGRFRREHLAAYFSRVYHPGEHRDRRRRPPRARTRCRARAPALRGPAPGARRPGNGPRPAVGRPRRRALEEGARAGPPLPRGPRLPAGAPRPLRGYVLNTVLGGSMSSRLFQNVREKRGLVYSISSGITAYSDAGCSAIYAGTSLDSARGDPARPSRRSGACRASGCPEEELRRAKDHIKGGLVLSLESSARA